MAFDQGLDKTKPLKDQLTRPTKLCTRIAKQIHSQGLVDIWRELNPKCRDFTHFSSPHQSYARIDHILIPTTLIPLANRASILDIAWSDHSLVLLSLRNVLTGNRDSSWRLNESLLSDPIHTKMIADGIKAYFSLNDVENISPETLWAAHKATFRGELIRLATQVKKERLIDI